jgi:hypothetical protein
MTMVVHTNHARRSYAPAPGATPTLDGYLRRRLEAVIEAAIDLLDALDEGDEGDGFVDDEDDGGAEPWLGAPEAAADRLDQRQWTRGGDSDRELAVEPSLRPRQAPPATARRELVSPALIELAPGVTIQFADPETRIFIDRAGRQYHIPPDAELAPLLPGERLLIGQNGDQYRLAPHTPFPPVDVAR